MCLRKSFFEREVDLVAEDLLGFRIVHELAVGRIGGRIVETEAYNGLTDPGSHAFRSPNGRARIMFGPPGLAYVHFTYGMHFCMNVVCGSEGAASAVLIRAVEPLWGLNLMREAGFPKNLPDHKLLSGPGRVCRALHVGRNHNGANLMKGPLRIIPPQDREGQIQTGVRIGLTTDDGRPWRFALDSKSVSARKPRPNGVAGRGSAGNPGGC